jgi:2-methylcitrate dehydratase PrpD
MGNLNIDYLLHVALEDRALSLQAAHDEARFRSWLARGPDSRITVEADPELGTSHAAHVDVEMSDGRTFSHFVRAIPGSIENPMSRDDVESKALGLLAPTLGIDRAQGFIASSRHLEDIEQVRDLTNWLSA